MVSTMDVKSEGWWFDRGLPSAVAGCFLSHKLDRCVNGYGQRPTNGTPPMDKHIHPVGPFRPALNRIMKARLSAKLLL